MCRSDESENQEDFIWPSVLLFQKSILFQYRTYDREKRCSSRRRSTAFKTAAGHFLRYLC